MSSDNINNFILDKLEKVDDKLEEVRLKYSKLEESFKTHQSSDEKIHKSVENMADEVGQKMTEISKSLDGYNELLKQHIRRTEIAEQNIENIKEAIQPVITEYCEKKIITRYDAKIWKNIAMYTGAISTLVGLVIGLMKLLEFF